MHKREWAELGSPSYTRSFECDSSVKDFDTLSSVKGAMCDVWVSLRRFGLTKLVLILSATIDAQC